MSPTSFEVAMGRSQDTGLLVMYPLCLCLDLQVSEAPLPVFPKMKTSSYTVISASVHEDNVQVVRNGESVVLVNLYLFGVWLYLSCNNVCHSIQLLDPSGPIPMSENPKPPDWAPTTMSCSTMWHYQNKLGYIYIRWSYGRKKKYPASGSLIFLRNLHF